MYLRYYRGFDIHRDEESERLYIEQDGAITDVMALGASLAETQSWIDRKIGISPKLHKENLP